MFRFFNQKNEFQFSHCNEDKIIARICKGKNVIVKPISYRYYTKGISGKYIDGQVLTDPCSGGVRVGKPSTTVKLIEYMPKVQICKVTFRNKNKPSTYKMTVQEFKTFIGSDSKGEWIKLFKPL